MATLSSTLSYWSFSWSFLTTSWKAYLSFTCSVTLSQKAFLLLQEAFLSSSRSFCDFFKFFLWSLLHETFLFSTIPQWIFLTFLKNLFCLCQEFFWNLPSFSIFPRSSIPKSFSILASQPFSLNFCNFCPSSRAFLISLESRSSFSKELLCSFLVLKSFSIFPMSFEVYFRKFFLPSQ